MHREDSYEKVNYKSSWKFMETIIPVSYPDKSCSKIMVILTRFAVKEYERKIL